jgi:hypothetical protein
VQRTGKAAHLLAHRSPGFNRPVNGAIGTEPDQAPPRPSKLLACCLPAVDTVQASAPEISGFSGTVGIRAMHGLLLINCQKTHDRKTIG